MWYKTLSWGKIHPCSECFYLLFHLQYFISVFSTILGLLSPWTLAWFTGGLGIIRFMFSSNLNASMISCLVHRAHIFCVFKCQICKSGGERICTVLSCCNLFSFSTVSATIIPVHIQWQNSHSLHLVRISSTPLSLRGLLEGKNPIGPVSALQSVCKTGTP